MVEIRRDDGSGYCIDSTEVTKGDFAKFFDEGRSSYTSPWCEGIPLNSTVALVEEQFKDPARADFPSTHGDWCDWEAYCAWAGKRLCGGRDGAHVTETTPLEDNELLYACTNGGEQEFPYGAMHEPARCNDRDSPGLEPIEVATADCEGGFLGLFDLAGNVGEAINNLVADDDTLYGYRFVTLGGDYLEKVVGCSTERPYQVTDYSAPMSGFRCCRTLE